MELKCLIVDDEPLARKGMGEYVREVGFLKWVGDCGNATQAIEILNKGAIDLMFLDIQMPGMTGLELLRGLQNPPMVIITTAFTEFALEGYELEVIDYLVKPIPFNRFSKAVGKARDFYLLKHNQPGSSPTPYIFVKSSGKYERLLLDEILYVEAMQNYVIIHITGHKYIVYMTMAGMETKLPGEKFMRVHKSFIASLAKVNAIEDNDLIIGNARVPISRNLKEQVSSRILGGSLLKR